MKVQPPKPNPTNTFPSTYYSLCTLYNVPVQTHLMNHEPNVLYLDVDKLLKDQDWSPILKAIKKTKDLKRITIRTQIKSTSVTRFQVTTVSPTARMLPDLVTCLKDSMLKNPYLTHLELDGLALRDVNLKMLSKGLMNNESIRYLSFKRTKMGDSGVFVLAPSIRTIKTLAVLNLSGCRLTEKGAHIIAAFLKSLAVRRQADKWASSLRQDIPPDPTTKDKPKPLKRLILAGNELGDEGVIPLFDLILEEVGLCAIDLQANNLSNKSAKRAISIMKHNHDLVILDLKNNRIDPAYIDLLQSILDRNRNGLIENGSIKRNDLDLVPLGPDPFKSIYKEDVEMAQRLRQTESSVKKLSFRKYVPVTMTKPKGVIENVKSNMNTSTVGKSRKITVIPKPRIVDQRRVSFSSSPKLPKKQPLQRSKTMNSDVQYQKLIQENIEMKEKLEHFELLLKKFKRMDLFSDQEQKGLKAMNNVFTKVTQPFSPDSCNVLMNSELNKADVLPFKPKDNRSSTDSRITPLDEEDLLLIHRLNQSKQNPPPLEPLDLSDNTTESTNLYESLLKDLEPLIDKGGYQHLLDELELPIAPHKQIQKLLLDLDRELSPPVYRMDSFIKELDQLLGNI